MLTTFKKFQREACLFSSNDIILLAVSGGVDSMVMAHLFKSATFKFAIAHCNFQLRGKDSDEEASLVKQLALDWKVPFHSIRFDTIKEGKKQKKSIELIARELRYNWFEALSTAFNYKYIATAHHLNDSIETVIYNLTKGTGIRGLHGIPIKNKKIIRPLSFATRREIEAYAKDNNILYREDASNFLLEHNRNRIRQEVIPSLKIINPALEQTFSNTLFYLKEAELLFNWAIAEKKKNLVKIIGEGLKISIVDLMNEAAKATILFEIINDFGFNSHQVPQIISAINHVGAKFYSKTHQLLIDRQFLILIKLEETIAVFEEIKDLNQQVSVYGYNIHFERLPHIPTNLNQGSDTAIIDANKVKWPLIIRNWKKGDRFQPLGMKGKSKKVKDYLRDQKISRLDKEKVLLLESDGKMIWLINYRQDERFKVGKNTKETIMIHFRLKKH
jgi:tRNA(Ile)-lysidine synthase